MPLLGERQAEDRGGVRQPVRPQVPRGAQLGLKPQSEDRPVPVDLQRATAEGRVGDAGAASGGE